MKSKCEKTEKNSYSSLLFCFGQITVSQEATQTISTDIGPLYKTSRASQLHLKNTQISRVNKNFF